MADMTPPAAAAAFIANLGWAGEIVPLAGDASFRRYFRVRGDGRNAVLMDAPPPHEDPRPFLDVAQWLTTHGFPAPTIIGADLDQGLVLLEDFGDARMREAIDDEPDATRMLYERAVDLLIELRRHPAGPFEPYDRAVLHREADLLTEWYCPAVGIDADLAGYTAAWDRVFDRALQAEPRHRAARLSRRKSDAGWEGTGRSGCSISRTRWPGILLMISCRCCRMRVATSSPRSRPLCCSIIAQQPARARNSLPPIMCSARSVTPRSSAFSPRLWKRDGKPRYPTLCPRVWRYLEADLAQPVLAPVAAWFDANIPPAMRGDPSEIAA